MVITYSHNDITLQTHMLSEATAKKFKGFHLLYELTRDHSPCNFHLECCLFLSRHNSFAYLILTLNFILSHTRLSFNLSLEAGTPIQSLMLYIARD